MENWGYLMQEMGDLLAPSMAKDHPNLPVIKAEGCHYFGLDGKTYLDFTSGIATENVGHRHPKVVQAVKDGLESLMHGPSGVIMYEKILMLAKELGEVMPGDLDCFFFANSGSEAIEGAMKLAKFVTKRPYVISFTGCFHGRTMGSLSVSTSKSKYRKHLQPNWLVYQVPYQDKNADEQTAVKKLEEDIASLFAHQVSPDEVACMIVEPILGEGGYIVPHEAWLKKVREICSRHGILLIFDEVQTGFGRTGEMFAAQTFDVTPDIMAIAKAIASGLPLSATVASKELMQQWPLGSHGTTFGGNPLACQSALATLKVLKEENLLDNSKSLGLYALNRLKDLKEKYPVISNVRGRGLMIGIEFSDPVTGKPDGSMVKEILDLALEEGLLLYLCGNEGEVIRFIPPLTVTKDEIDQGLEMFEKAIIQFTKKLNVGV